MFPETTTLMNINRFSEISLDLDYRRGSGGHLKVMSLGVVGVVVLVGGVLRCMGT